MKLSCPRSSSLKRCYACREAYNLLKYIILLCSALALLLFFVTYVRGFNRLQDPHIILDTSTSPEKLKISAAEEQFPAVKEFERRTGKFDNEQARLIGFPIRDIHTKATEHPKIIYLATKYFGEWNPKHYYFLHLGNTTFIQYPCAFRSCYVTNHPSDLSTAHAVLFHVRDLEVFSLPPSHPTEQIWILYSMEPPWLEIRDMTRFEGVFNWTMSYRRDSDLLTSYGFIGKRETAAEFNRQKLENLFEEKHNKALWYVSNCQTDSNREEYALRLRNVYPVDIIGGCGVEGCRPAESKRCYTKLVKVYKFYLAFENALCRDYVTEKLFNALAYHLVPVTFGGANYSRIVPPNSIINAMDFPSPEELGKFLWQVSENRSLYLSYFEWKKEYRSYLQPWMCNLCEKLHEPLTHNTAFSLDTWWNEEGSCQRWSTGNFVPVKNPVFPQYHTHKFQ